MEKKVTYRLVDGAFDDGSALLVASDGGIGSTTEMDVVQARNGLPKIIQKDRLVYNRQDDAFYVGRGDGSPKRVADIRVYARMNDLPSQGDENRLYICLREHTMAVWTEGSWKHFSTAPVAITTYSGVSTFDDRQSFPAKGEAGHIYLTKDGYGYAYIDGKYEELFGAKLLSWTKAEADARFAFKKDIPAEKTLDDLGGITPHDVDVKVQDAKDEIEAAYAKTEELDSVKSELAANIAKKEDKGVAYSKSESDAKYALKENIPTVSSLGVITSEQAEAKYAKKTDVDDVKQIATDAQTKANTISSYAKTEDVKALIKSSIEESNPDFSIYATKDEVDKEIDKKLSGNKDDAKAFVKQEDLADYAKKADIPTLDSLGGLTKADAEKSYAKADDVAAARKLATDTQDSLAKSYYTKADVDQKISDEAAARKNADALYLEKTAYDDAIKAYAKTADLSAYAKADDLKTKADTSSVYSKDEVDAKISSVQEKGVDLTGYLKKNDDASKTYIGDTAKSAIDVDSLQKTDGLLAEVIKQDRAKGSNLVLDYFVNKDDIRDASKAVTEKGTLSTDEDGKQHIAISGQPNTHGTWVSPIALFINGVRCDENEEYTYDSSLNRIDWKGSYTIEPSDEIRLEYGTSIAGTEAPKAESSSTAESATEVRIASDDIKTIQDCTVRSEAAEKLATEVAEKAKASSGSAGESAEKAAASAKIAQEAEAAIRAIVQEALQKIEEAKKS